MADFDNTALLADIRERGSLPSQDLRFTDAKLLTAASLELRDVIAPLMVEVQTERLVYLSDTTATAGQAEYRMPTRALAARVKSVGWKGPSDTAFTALAQLSADAYYLQGTTEGTPTGFFLRDYAIVLVPTPNVAGTLRVPYYCRPNALVATSAVGVVTAVGATTLTVASAPGTFTSGAFYDVVRGTPGFETLVTSATATVAGNVLTFDSLPSGLAAGDYVCLSGQAPVAQCPVELRGLLATRTARRALVSVGDSDQATLLDADVQELTEVARRVLAPRVDAAPMEFGDSTRGLLYGVV